MGEEERRTAFERRLRRAAAAAASREVPEEADPREDSAADEAQDDSEAALRLEQKTLWVDLQVRRAIERGEFDDLPGAGKPIRGLGGTYDPDWWVKGLIERESLTALLPPALALRKEDAELGTRLDRETTEAGVRRVVEDFNDRVVEARRQLLGGPPVITPTRDVDAEVQAWQARREERRREQARLLAEMAPRRPSSRRRRWWRWRYRRD